MTLNLGKENILKTRTKEVIPKREMSYLSFGAGDFVLRENASFGFGNFWYPCAVFGEDENSSVYIIFASPPDMKEGTVLKTTVWWAPEPSANAGDVRLSMYQANSKEGQWEGYNESSKLDIISIPIDTDTIRKTDFIIDDFPEGPDQSQSVIAMYLRRTGGNPDDTYDKDIFVYAITAEYEVDKEKRQLL